MTYRKETQYQADTTMDLLKELTERKGSQQQLGDGALVVLLLQITNQLERIAEALENNKLEPSRTPDQWNAKPLAQERKR